MFVVLIVCTASAIFLSQCQWDKLYDPNAPCFETDIQPLLNSSCAMSGCHDAITMQSGLDLSQTNDILSLVNPKHHRSSRLYLVITGGGEDLMPPDPNAPLTQSQIDMIAAWIDAGAPVVPGCSAFAPCDTVANPTFTNNILPLVNDKCNGCHRNASTGGNILLTNYTQIKTQVDNGKFLGSVMHNSGYQPMPKNSSQLNSCQLDMIQTWINAGAPNN